MDWTINPAESRNNLGNLHQLTGWVLLLGFGLLLSPWARLVPRIGGALLLLLVVIGLAWCVLLWKRGLQLLSTPLDTGLLALFSALTISTIFSTDPSRGWQAIWQLAATIILYYVAVALFRSGWSFKVFVKSLLIVLAIALIAALFQFWLWGWTWFQAMGPTWPPTLLRVWGITDNPNTFGAMIAVGVVLACAYMLAAPAQRRPAALWLWLLTAVGLLVLTRSRGAWLAALLGCFFLFSGNLASQMAARQRLRRRWLALIAGFLSVVLVLMLLLIWLRPETFELGGTIQSRLTYWKIAIATWQASPLLGAGPNIYLTRYLERVPVPFAEVASAPHNVLLSLLSQSGLPGLLAFLFLLFRSAQTVWMQWRQGLLGIWPLGAASALLALFVYSLFDIVEARPSLLITGALLLAAVMADPVWASHHPRRGKVAAIWLPVWLAVLATGFLGWRANSQYEAGLSAIAEGHWESAAGHFDEAQSLTLSQDSSLLYASAMARGVLAGADPAYLSAAIREFRALVAAEPGWSANYANLAALYWQDGAEREALEAMRQAIELSPAVPIYHLNLGLWLESLGDAQGAMVAYRQLLSLPGARPDSPFWQSSELRRLAVGELAASTEKEKPAGWLALDAGQPESAAAAFQTTLAATPLDFNAQFGLAVAQLQLGEVAAATESFQRASSIDKTGQVSLAGERGASIALWTSSLPGAEPEAISPALARFTRQSIYGPGQGTSRYMVFAFGRSPFPIDLLPQLECITVSPQLAGELRRFGAWHELEGNPAVAERVERIIAGNGDGLTPCFQP